MRSAAILGGSGGGRASDQTLIAKIRRKTEASHYLGGIFNRTGYSAV